MAKARILSFGKTLVFGLAFLVVLAVVFVGAYELGRDSVKAGLLSGGFALDRFPPEIKLHNRGVTSLAHVGPRAAFAFRTAFVVLIAAVATFAWVDYLRESRRKRAVPEGNVIRQIVVSAVVASAIGGIGAIAGILSYL